jgi:hypothetical protein
VQPELSIRQPNHVTLGNAGGVLKHNRSWLSLVAYCLVTTLGAALVFAVIVAGGSVALASHQNPEAAQDNAPTVPQHSDLETFTGMVTDSHCGARHLRHTNLAPAECAAVCIRKGAAYILVNGHHRYILSGDEPSLKKLLGTRATVTGRLEGDTIQVNSSGPSL